MFYFMLKKGNNERGLHVLVLELSAVLLLLTSFCKLSFKAVSLPVQLIVTFNIRVTIGPELGKRTF